MTRKIHEEDESHPDPSEGEGLLRGTVKRLFETGAAAPKAASLYLAEQFGGWKQDFLGIFQSELRRFLDKQNLSEELRRLLDGQKVELTASVRLVRDGAKPEKKPAPAKKAKRR